MMPCFLQPAQVLVALVTIFYIATNARYTSTTACFLIKNGCRDCYNAREMNFRLVPPLALTIQSRLSELRLPVPCEMTGAV